VRTAFMLLSGLALVASATTANAATTVGFEELQSRDSFGGGWNNWNSYKGFVWGYGITGGVENRVFNGNLTGWASGTLSNAAVSPAPSGTTGTAYAWTWNGPQSLWIDFGAAIDVTSVDLANLSSNFGSNNSQTVELFGYNSSDSLIGSTAPVSLTSTFQTVNANIVGARYLELRSNGPFSCFSVDQLVLDGTAPAVPEPATWAMMLLGFGFVGGTLRSAKRRQKLTVTYA
jgi:PEP-CTERM motif